ncbi:MAG TPA: GNAT family N-acetyltransferase [Solirubrobacteraceae bacterium]
MSVVVRAAREEDEDALSALDHRLWATNHTPSPRPPSPRPFLTGWAAEHEVLVAEVEGALAGYVAVGRVLPIEANAHVLEVKGLLVDPAHRRRGIGAALVRAAVDAATRRGARRLTLRVLAANPEARALYEAEGFVVEGVLRGEFLLDGRYVDDVLMALELPRG